VNALPVGVMIGAQVLKDAAVGDTIEQRFKAIITPANLRSACYMCATEDEEFRAAVGALMLSYGASSEERRRISAEMLQIQRLSTWLTALQLGMSADAPIEEAYEPIGLMQIWRERQK
jgi:hypothetical protein